MFHRFWLSQKYFILFVLKPSSLGRNADVHELGLGWRLHNRPVKVETVDGSQSFLLGHHPQPLHLIHEPFVLLENYRILTKGKVYIGLKLEVLVQNLFELEGLQV